ncbi:cytosolic sulfotransferase 7-like [Malania oleifera]|uniref:cytosolic sulfotransferase 7-like n=1 Tax=Malania oleifera TaxID=397392 RepID=UPI0025ADE8DD|nr:cytosolic sulfotransferase 7-like [Malania oleifera]
MASPNNPKANNSTEESQHPTNKNNPSRDYREGKGGGRSTFTSTKASAHFRPRPTDVLLVTYPKSGTTWLKALALSLTGRSKHHDYYASSHPLLAGSPHDSVPFLEFSALGNPTNPNPDLPLMATHIPYSSLPRSVSETKCRIVYLLRDPKDVVVSLWHFTSKHRSKELPPVSLEEAFELFCQGVSPQGPFWDHALGYWKASLEYPERVLVLKYEELKKEPFVSVKRLAEFLGCLFTSQEEKEGGVHKVIEFCSFEKLSNLEVKKTGKTFGGAVESSVFFRKGEVGDSVNHLTPEMIERIDQITKRWLHGEFPLSSSIFIMILLLLKVNLANMRVEF